MLSFRPLNAEDVEVRVSQIGDTAVKLLLYKDARVDMRLLDETVGPENWQCRYEVVNGNLFCDVGLRFKDGEWVWKQDVGIPSNMESTKGEASDAFKRACFKWGIGRELYTAPDIFVKRDQCAQIRQGRNGREQCYDKFVVTEMTVNDGHIDSLQICNMSNKSAVVYGKQPGKQKQEGGADRFARVLELRDEAVSIGISKEGIVSWMNANVLRGNQLKDATDEQIAEIEEYIATLIRDHGELHG